MCTKEMYCAPLHESSSDVDGQLDSTQEEQTARQTSAVAAILKTRQHSKVAHFIASATPVDERLDEAPGFAD